MLRLEHWKASHMLCLHVYCLFCVIIHLNCDVLSSHCIIRLNMSRKCSLIYGTHGDTSSAATSSVNTSDPVSFAAIHCVWLIECYTSDNELIYSRTLVILNLSSIISKSSITVHEVAGQWFVQKSETLGRGVIPKQLKQYFCDYPSN